MLGVLLCTGWSQQDPPPDPKYATLANQLFLAPNDAAREQLLEANRNLVGSELGTAMQLIAGQVFDRHEYDAAFAMYRTTCEVAVEVRDKLLHAKCAYNMGLSEARRLHPDDAMELYQQSLALYEKLPMMGDLVGPLNSIAILLSNRGELLQAVKYYERALDAAAESGNEVLLAQTNNNLGNVLHRLGRYRDAVRRQQTALEITRRLGMERQAALVMNSLGSTYYDQHELDLALSYNEQSLAIREKRKDPVEMASSMLNVGVVHLAMGDREKALGNFERVLQLTTLPELTATRIRALYNIGNLYSRDKNYAAARPRLEAAIKLAESIGDMADINGCRIILGQMANEQGSYPVAEQLARSAADYARSSGERQMLVTALDLLGVTLRDQDRPQEAEVALREAIQTTEELRQELPGDRQGAINYMDQRMLPYLHMVQVQLDRGRAESALAYVERGKARSLLDVLQSGTTGIQKAMTAEERDQETVLAQTLTHLDEQILKESHRPNPDRRRITEWGAQLEKARTEYHSFETVLYAAHPQLKVQRIAFDPVKPADLLATLPDSHTALLEYAVLDGGVYLFVLTRAAGAEAQPDLRVYRLSAKKHALQRDVWRYRQQVSTRDLDYRKLAASLYRDLVEPAAEQLRGTTTLVIAPDAFLWQLPFQALEPEANRYLLQDHAIFYTPSLSVLHEVQSLQKDRAPANSRLLAMDATQLPTARREVQGLRELYGRSRVQVYSGAAADEELLRREAPNYDVVHLAAHGVFEDRNPLNSYLVLGKAGKPEAGVLEAREMMELNLHAGMVVLSGCETGRGRSDGGEGFIGMSWALFVAGSPATVASQWKVESNATADLMLGFHRRLKRESKAKALQEAALEVMKNPEYRHPFYWSGFVLMGQGF